MRIDSSLPDAALVTLAPQLLAAHIKATNDPNNVPLGEIRKIERLDDYGRLKYIDRIGQHSFVKDMTRPGRRVVRFMTPADSHGRAIRSLRNLIRAGS